MFPEGSASGTFCRGGRRSLPLKIVWDLKCAQGGALGHSPISLCAPARPSRRSSAQGNLMFHPDVIEKLSAERGRGRFQ